MAAKVAKYIKLIDTAHLVANKSVEFDGRVLAAKDVHKLGGGPNSSIYANETLLTGATLLTDALNAAAEPQHKARVGVHLMSMREGGKEIHKFVKDSGEALQVSKFASTWWAHVGSVTHIVIEGFVSPIAASLLNVLGLRWAGELVMESMCSVSPEFTARIETFLLRYGQEPLGELRNLATCFREFT